jgi:hypothetical protein
MCEIAADRNQWHAVILRPTQLAKILYFLARSVVDIIETGWNLSLEKRM